MEVYFVKDCFELVLKYQFQGDQLKVIEKFVKGIQEGKKYQILLGVIGMGKIFMVFNLIKEVNKLMFVIVYNKIFVGQFYSEFKEFFLNNVVEYFVSYYDYYQLEVYVF